MSAVLLLGEPLYSVQVPSDGFRDAQALHGSIGGAEVNVAVGLARLGHRVTFVGAVGDDEPGRGIVQHLRDEGVDTTDLIIDPDAPTGIVLSTASAAGDRIVTYRRERSAASLCSISMEKLDALRGGHDHVHVTGITFALCSGLSAAALELIRNGIERGATASFDPNFRPAFMSVDVLRATVGELEGHGVELLLSEEEATLATGNTHPASAAQELARRGFEPVIVRQGSRGSLGRDRNIEVHQPAIPVSDAVDSIGAGDAYTAGYLHERLEGGGFADAMECGAWAAARVVATRGDHAGAPNLAAYRAWKARDVA